MRWCSLFLLLFALNNLLAQPKVTIAPLEPSLASVVAVVDPSDPAAFQAAVANALPSDAIQAFARILPYSIVVRNTASIPVIYAIAYVDVVDDHGRASRNMLGSGGGFPPSGTNDFLLAPGQAMLTSPDSRYNAAAVHFGSNRGVKKELPQRPIEQYDSAASITFVLDSVVFADGRFVGPDKANAFNGWSNRLANEAAVARAVLAFEGRSAEDLQGYLASVVATPRPSANAIDISPAKEAASYQRVLKDKGLEYVFANARNMLQRASDFSIHR
jgi:hypothetical protein